MDRVAGPGAVRALEGYLYHYAEVVRGIEARWRDLAVSGSDRDAWETGIRQQHRLSDPTYTRAVVIDSDEQLHRERAVVAAVEAVLGDYTLRPDYHEVLLRWYGLRGRMRQHWRQIAEDLALSRPTVYRYREVMLGRILARVPWLGGPDTED
jgi:hypothetical protein